VVVGSGPGGTTSAKIISENTNTSIAVIEEGIENDEKIEMGTHEDLSKRYRYGGAELIFSTPNISIAEGRGLGGGSEINSGIYHRIQDQVIQNWSEKFKIEDLTNSSLDEHYKFIEKWLKVEKTGKKPKSISKKLVDLASASNLEIEECKTWNKNQISEKKQSMKAAFYNLENNNVSVFTNMKAIKIIFDSNGKAKSLICKKGGKSVVFNFKKLILSCGTFQTPLLLRKSNYKFIHKTTFNIHPHLKLGAKFFDTLEEGEIVSNYQIKLDEYKSSIGSSINSEAWKALFLLDNWFQFKEEDLTNQLKKLGIFYSMIQPKGFGKMYISKRFDNYLLTYRFHEDDIISLFKTTELLIDMLLKSDVEKLYLPNKNIHPIEKNSNISMQNFKDNFKYFNIHSVHTFSSIRMGNQFAECDSNGTLKNSMNTLVADASILPGPPGINPQGPLMVLTAKNVFKFIDV